MMKISSPFRKKNSLPTEDEFHYFCRNNYGYKSTSSLTAQLYSGVGGGWCLLSFPVHNENLNETTLW